MVRRAIVMAEIVHGRPVFVQEIHNQLSKMTHFCLLSVTTFWACSDLYQNDEILGDKLCDQWTFNPKYQKTAEHPEREYELYSDRKERKWPNYEYDELGILKPTERQETINFNTLKKLLLSPNTEENRNQLEQIVSTQEPKFLDKKVSFVGNRIHMASYSRSGNSFLRKFIEQISGVYTGSDLHLRDVLTLQ